MNRTLHHCSAFLLPLLGSIGALSAQVEVWDAAADYSATQNPSGAWTYGWALNRGAPINVFRQSGLRFCASIFGWGDTARPFLMVSKNPSATTTDCSCASLRVPPDKLVIHPGGAGENSVLRWTAPDTGRFRIEVDFVGVDFQFPTNSDVSVMRNDTTQLFAMEVNAFDGPANCTSTTSTPSARYADTLQLNAGDTIDARCGFGFLQRFNGDSTMVEFHVTRVATLESLGTPCNGRTQLGSSNLPLLGTPIALGVSMAVTNGQGIVQLASGAPTPAPVFGCTLYPDQGRVLGSLLVSTNGLGQWQRSILLPSDPSFHGFQLTLQALMINQATPLVIGFSNGLLLTL